MLNLSVDERMQELLDTTHKISVVFGLMGDYLHEYGPKNNVMRRRKHFSS